LKTAERSPFGSIIYITRSGGYRFLTLFRNRGYGFLMPEEPVNPRNAAMGSVGTALGGYGGGKKG